MCKRKICPHTQDTMCSCPEIQSRDRQLLAEFLSRNMTQITWELDYASLDHPQGARLCVSAVCRRCGGRQCIREKLETQTGMEEFLQAVYIHRYRGRSVQEQSMDTEAFHARFLSMFHEQDKPRVKHWLSEPENVIGLGLFRSQVDQVFRAQKSAITIYSIVRTAIDTDRGFFPDPAAMGSYLSRERAHNELRRLVAEEKLTLDAERYNAQDSGEDYWEAYQKDSAASCSVRLEILVSEITLTPADNMPETFHPANYMEQCAHCRSVYGNPACTDEESECGLLDEAEHELGIIAAKDRAAQSTLLARLHPEFCCCDSRKFDDPDMALAVEAARLNTESWQLDYTRLKGKEARVLSRIGKCLICGKTVSCGIHVETDGTEEDLFAKIWLTLKKQAAPTSFAPHLKIPGIAEALFTGVFHEEDQHRARAWFRNCISEMLAKGEPV